ncbi:hypothetical protein [uncultured Acidaminococcus sp.]|uniref:hypothetical protein n=1 Tax=uncultured Acidaminococcus sp. TaxID=352152 RepID=UPI002665E616|nr:hypothetical protein [uncultured Acidaminococcus sp.]
MMENTYKIIDDFPVKTMRALVLDREYEFGDCEYAEIDGKKYHRPVARGSRFVAPVIAVFRQAV